MPFQANAWRTRFALTPIAAAKRRDKVGATLSPTFCFLPPAAGGPYIDLERAEPPPPIVDTEWRQGAFDMGAGSHVSLMFAGRSSEEVVEMGETLEQSWFESLKVSALFTDDEKEKLFSNLSAMKAGAEGASSASAPSVADRCAAHGSRVVRLIMEVMCKGRLEGLEESSWMFALAHDDDLAWLLEVLGDKAKLVDDTLEKEEVDEDVFKTAFTMGMGVWEAVKKLLSKGKGAPVRADVDAARVAHSELRRYIQLMYPYALNPFGPGFCSKPDTLYEWVDRKLGRLSAEDLGRVIGDEEAELTKVASARAARRGESGASRRASLSDDGYEIVDSEEGAQKLAKGGLSLNDIERFDKAASANELVG